MSLFRELNTGTVRVRTTLLCWVSNTCTCSILCRSRSKQLYPATPSWPPPGLLVLVRAAVVERERVVARHAVDALHLVLLERLHRLEVVVVGRHLVVFTEVAWSVVGVGFLAREPFDETVVRFVAGMTCLSIWCGSCWIPRGRS